MFSEDDLTYGDNITAYDHRQSVQPIFCQSKKLGYLITRSYSILKPLSEMIEVYLADDLVTKVEMLTEHIYPSEDIGTSVVQFRGEDYMESSLCFINGVSSTSQLTFLKEI